MSYSGVMSQLANDQDERDNLSGMDLFEAYWYQQQALPAHKRDGYAERMQEAAEAQRTEARESYNPF